MGYSSDGFGNIPEVREAAKYLNDDGEEGRGEEFDVSKGKGDVESQLSAEDEAVVARLEAGCVGVRLAAQWLYALIFSKPLKQFKKAGGPLSRTALAEFLSRHHDQADVPGSPIAQLIALGRENIASRVLNEIEKRDFLNALEDY